MNKAIVVYSSWFAIAPARDSLQSVIAMTESKSTIRLISLRAEEEKQNPHHKGRDIVATNQPLYILRTDETPRTKSQATSGIRQITLASVVINDMTDVQTEMIDVVNEVSRLRIAVINYTPF